MSRIAIAGIGAVSPAGWGVEPLVAAVQRHEPLPVTQVPREPRRSPLTQRMIPPPDPRPAWMAHPRLRRASTITHYTVSAALEALGSSLDNAPAISRLGVIVTVMNGSVTYSRRFFDEVLRSPSTASPALFPETVFNAPASHLAAVLGAAGLNYTLVGDPSAFLEGLAIAADWLTWGEVERALVVGAEEPDWITAEAWNLFGSGIPSSGGAGAVLMSAPSKAGGAELGHLTEGFSYSDLAGREQALAAAPDLATRSASLRPLLVDGRVGARRYDQAETGVWSDWNGTRLSPKRVLGEGFAAGPAWQCVLAVDAIRRGLADVVLVSSPGFNGVAACARFQQARA